MVTIQEIKKYLEDREGRILTADELIAILNGCGLITIGEAIKKTKEEQKKDRPL